MACVLLFGLSSCNPYAASIGHSLSTINDRKRTQIDQMPVIAGTGIVERLQLVRRKESGRVAGYSVEVAVSFPSKLQVRGLTFEGEAGKAIRLSGSSVLGNVSARTYGVYYRVLGSFPIQASQIRDLADFESVTAIVAAEIDLTPVEIGPRGISAIREFREQFVDGDGVGESVLQETPTKSE